MTDWQPWIEECHILLDGDGAFNSFPYPGTYREQPAYDMSVFQIIRKEFNRLKNDKMQRSIDDAKRIRK